MDEPTNDLDAETLDLLEEMVADYAGTLLLVSHDRAFLDNVVTSTLVFEGKGRIHEYVGGYSDWLRQRRPSPAAKKPATKKPAAKEPAANTTPARDPATPTAAGHAPLTLRKRSYKERRELDALPEKIQRLEAEQSALQAALSDPQLFRQNPVEAAAALERLQGLTQEVEAAYARWDALESL